MIWIVKVREPDGSIGERKFYTATLDEARAFVTDAKWEIVEDDENAGADAGGGDRDRGGDGAAGAGDDAGAGGAETGAGGSGGAGTDADAGGADGGARSANGTAGDDAESGAAGRPDADGADTEVKSKPRRKK